MFNHEGPVFIRAMRDITVRVFERLNITSPMDVDKRIVYTEHILRGAALQKYQEVLVTFRQLTNELAGDEWTFGKTTGISV